MKLSSVSMTNFRSCTDLTVDLADDLTVLVGENASGKSAIIDALRLATTSAIEQKGIAFSAEADPSQGAADVTNVEISTTYTELSEVEQSVYMTELVDANDTLIYNVSYSTNADLAYWKAATYSVGKSKVDDPEPLNRKRIAHVYLPPLRDAVRELDSGGGERLAEVLRVLTSTDKAKRSDFIEAANETLAGISALDLPKLARSSIDGHLNAITPPSRKHNVRLGGRRQELRRLAGLLRIQLADQDIDPMQLSSSGLGYANLLYVATIVVQLVNAQDYDLTVLLVEEPEAHLHPQLQSVLLNYLERQAVESRSTAPTRSLQPAGQIQVIVSTHSPNLASAVSVEKVVVIAREQHGSNSASSGVSPSPGATPAHGSSGGWKTSATALRCLSLKPHEFRKVNRYLSVTRSSLLFSRHVMLVEGVAEAILVPALARALYKGDSEALRHIASLTFVAIDGVDFLPYLNLLLSGSAVRVEKVVVITDGDPDKKGNRQGAARKESYESTFTKDVVAGRLVVEVGQTTLEAELFGHADNEEVLKAAYLDAHPKSEAKWNSLFADIGTDIVKRSLAFAAAIKQKDGLDLGKGDFAQLICERIGKETVGGGVGLKVPDYLQRAIASIVGDVSSSRELREAL